MDRLQSLWAKGVRIVQYPNGHRTELRMSSTGMVHEFPLMTEQEQREQEIAALERRIARDTVRLEQLK